MTDDPRYKSDLREEAKRLYREEKMTMQEVGEELGITMQRVGQILKDAGVRSRKRGPRRRRSR